MPPQTPAPSSGDIFATSVATFPTPGQGVALDLNGELPLQVQVKLPGYELGYTEFTSPVTISGSTEASATTVVSTPTVIVDGQTSVFVEFYAKNITAGNRSITISLWDALNSAAATSLGFIAANNNASAGATLATPCFAKRKLTPVQGSHVYTIKGQVDTSGTTGQVAAGAGGTGNNVPGYVRVIVA